MRATATSVTRGSSMPPQASAPAGPAGGRAEAQLKANSATRATGWPRGRPRVVNGSTAHGGLEQDPRADMHGMARGAAFSPRALSHRRVPGRLFPGFLLLPIGRAALGAFTLSWTLTSIDKCSCSATAQWLGWLLDITPHLY